METTTAVVENAVYTAEQIEHYAAEMDSSGYFVIEGALSPEQLEEARNALARVFELESDIGPERGWHTGQHMVAYMLAQKQEFYRHLAVNPKVLPLVQRVLGKTCVVTSLNGFTMPPGAGNQALHLDQIESLPEAVLNISAVYCLDDFTLENGATRIIPGSHKRIFDYSVPPATFEDETIQVTVSAGSLIVFNGGAWHGASSNTTAAYRRAVHVYYSRAWVRPHHDMTRSLTADTIAAMSEEEKQIFGVERRIPWYDSEKRNLIF